jgi:CubicO group peptidase (beta-lactamase class C family)
MKIKVLLIFSILIIFTINSFTQNNQIEFPDNQSGKTAAIFWQFVQSKDETALKHFIENQMLPKDDVSVEERQRTLGQIRRILSSATLHKILRDKDSEFIFSVKNKGRFEKITLQLMPDKNHLINGIMIEVVPEDELNDDSDKKGLSGEELVKTVGEYLENETKKDEFSGTVLIARAGVPVFEKSYGFANRKSQITNKTDTKFNLGSINKLFTMLAIGILADEGKISLDDKLGKHLPDYPNKDAREKVTITHLLTMSSGIGDIFGAKYDATPKAKLRTTKAYLPLFASEPLLFEPGSDRRYSNGGFLVLGAIIEKVSGKSYYDFVRERIFKPLEMKNTESFEADKKIPNMAEGYMTSGNGKGRINNIKTRPARGSSGGGGYSTAPDLLKFSNAIENGKFSVPKSLGKVNDPMLGGLFNKKLGFGGGAPGINAIISNKIGGDYTIIVLSNYDPPTASKTARQIRKWIGN